MPLINPLEKDPLKALDDAVKAGSEKRHSDPSYESEIVLSEHESDFDSLYGDDDIDNGDDDLSSSDYYYEDDEDDEEIPLSRPPQQPVMTAFGLLPMLGHAEQCRQKSLSKKHAFCPLRHATSDPDTAPGFRLRGFRDGLRVYRVDSPFLKKLQNSVVRTAAGFCYMNLAENEPKTTKDKVTGHLQVNDYFEIRPSPIGGLGSFALRDIPRGEHLLVERPLVRTTLFHLPRELEQLPTDKRDAFFALTGHHPNPNASDAERIWTANTFVAGPREEAVFSLASRFNHACNPRDNVGYRYDTRHDVLVMTTSRRVSKGDELTISYGKTPRMLYERFGFSCTCGACGGFTEEMAAQMYSLTWSK